jgi:hypothetical protein
VLSVYHFPTGIVGRLRARAARAALAAAPGSADVLEREPAAAPRSH